MKLVDEIVNPAKYERVTQRDLQSYRANGQLSVPSGPVLLNLQMIERFKKDFSHRLLAANHIIEIFGHYERWFSKKHTGDAVDMFSIGDIERFFVTAFDRPI